MHPIDMLLKEIREKDWAMTLRDAAPHRDRRAPPPAALHAIAAAPRAALVRLRMLAQRLRTAHGAAKPVRSTAGGTAVVQPAASADGFARLPRRRLMVRMVAQGREPRVCADWDAGCQSA